VSRLTKLTIILAIAATFSMLLPWFCPEVSSKQPKSKFYDFNDQIIDGEIKKPTTLYTDARDRVKFDRLMKLKKSFLPKLFATAKEKVFK
tara:strand:- start:155 stop:424 length:270 start_codon:yes stop_codon:yes gene_type:complete